MLMAELPNMDQLLRRSYVKVRTQINCIRLLGLLGVKIILQSWLGKRDLVPVQVSGTVVWMRLNSTDLATLLQIFRNREYEFDVDGNVDVIIDGGANVGYSAVYFALKYPEARIIAVEPHPENFALLQKNIERFPNIEALQAALWYKDEPVGLWDPEEGAWGFRVKQGTAASTETTEEVAGSDLLISGVSIDAILSRYELGSIDILKLDVEGSEKEIFEHADSWIDSVRVIVAELHDKYRTGCARSFYNATNDFSSETRLGENILLTRE